MSNRAFLIGSIMTVGVLVASVLLLPHLPEQVPTHWNIHGQVDGYGSKSFAAFMMPGLMLLTLLGFWILPLISPESFQVGSFRSTYLFIMLLLLAFYAYGHALMMWAALAPPVDVGKAVAGGIFVMIALLGNVLGKVRRNFWVGVRTPWTLDDERVWNDTHRFAARMYVAIGIIGLVMILLNAPIAALLLFLVASVMIPAVYSLDAYKRIHEEGTGSRTSIWVIGAVVIALVVAGIWGLSGGQISTGSGEIPVPPEIAPKAQALVQSLAKGHYEDARRDFDEPMRRELPAERLREIWQALLAANGTFVGEKDVWSLQLGGSRAVFVECEFQRNDKAVKVVFDRKGSVSGLWIEPGRKD